VPDSTSEAVVTEESPTPPEPIVLRDFKTEYFTVSVPSVWEADAPAPGAIYVQERIFNILSDSKNPVKVAIFKVQISNQQLATKIDIGKFRIVEEERILVNGVNGELTAYTSLNEDGANPITTILFFKNNLTYQVSYIINEQYSKSDDVSTEILKAVSTLNFLDPRPTSAPTDQSGAAAPANQTGRTATTPSPGLED
jgi:hypothetical protein